MALPILDGNQTAATLSTVLTGGEHIPAHTVVSLGSQAITDMRSAVSGSVVSISNFPSTQTIAGTVTANVFGKNSGGIGTSQIPIIPYYSQIEFAEIGNVIPVQISNNLGVIEQNNRLPISGTVTIGNSVTIGSLPAISGTVTANVPLVDTSLAGGVTQGVPVYLAGGKDGVVLDEINYVNNILSLPPISGTVTANTQTQYYDPVNLINVQRALVSFIVDESTGESYAVDSANGLPISGTVTANNPSGALTTRFGSVTTANTAQITSAVTNTSRKYLLAQNISAGTVTIGIGFSPTTTQGIQLTAGGGLTFDAFCPTGAVFWLGAVTGANYCLIEG